MSRDAVSRAELHRIFMNELAREAPDAVFVFDIDRRTPGADGCNWYPLASIGGWRGELTASLAVFRRVRERLAQDYVLAESDELAATAGAAARAPEPATA
ncbi:MAG TPA: hypothetical protein VFJ16_19520 [Longimicrobium sp.]|nr:hypothetical protein [Longimicrobium sp.]